MHITKDLNERLTQTGPGTPMGEVFRRYWIPALLTEEVGEPDGAPVRVRILSEDLVGFRDSSGEVGLVEAYCAHRRAPLFYGRNEECGLRCVYHGWKFDTQGTCVDMPSEPPYSKFRLRVAIKAYPTFESGGIVWTYMGPTAQMPPPPNYEWLRAPSLTHQRISKTGEHANWLQALEGGIDTAHSSFTHNNDLSNPNGLRVLDTHPTLEVDVTDYGFRYGSIRNISDDQSFVRVYQFYMPSQQGRAFLLDFDGKMNKVPSLEGHIWVPIDDENCYVYNWKYTSSTEHEITDQGWHDYEHWTGRAPEDMIPGSYWLKQNLWNDYLVDREMQRTKTFTGISGLNTQDFALQEGMGSIVRRDLEALGSTDRAIQSARDLLLEAANDVETGKTPRGTDPATYAYVRPGELIMARGTPWRDATKDILETVW
jgi:phenylpropionate dioxygenase-like ring-hydroxylating dioxygenase large terminal subunit